VGLEVAVDHTAPVSEASSLEDLDRDVDRADRIERRLLADQLLERATRQVLHRDVVGVLERAAVVHAHHVRVLQAGRGLGLSAETLDEVGIGRKPPVQELERHLAAKLLVLGEEHVGHAAGAEARENLVSVVDDRSGREIGHGHCPSDSRVWMTCLAIGAATVPPNPPWLRSTVTATATFGLSTGANPINHGCVRFEPTVPTCAVPVLPATLMLPS
jgi:hypothetical protein